MDPEFFQRYWIFGFFLLAIILYTFAVAGYYVQEDAKKLGFNKAAITFWSVGTVFLGLIILPLYLIFRSRAVFTEPDARLAEESTITILCPHCGEKNDKRAKICSKCKKRIDIIAPSIGQKSCTFCGTMNPVEADRCSQCGQIIGYAE